MKPIISPFTRLLQSSAALLAVLPFAAFANVTLDFNTDLQGVTAGSSGTSVVWSPEFGGSIAYTVPSGYVQNAATLNLLSTPELTQEYQNAIAGGGSLAFTIHVKQSGITGTGNPGWFEGFVIANSQGTYDQQYGSAGGVFNVGGFPLSEDFTTTVTMPIVGVAAGGHTQNNSKLEFNTASGYAELLFGLNSGSGNGLYTGATLYISQIVISGAPPPPPPVLGAYTFDQTVEGFGAWHTDTDDGGPVTWSANFGGTAKMGAHTNYWNLSKAITSGPQLANLRNSIERGGTVSYDIIGPVGTLASRNFSTAIQSYSGYNFSQVDRAIDPSAVVALPDGVNEIGRLTLAMADFPKMKDAGGFGFFVGYNPIAPTEVPLYIDNIAFSSYSSDSATLTFDDSSQNLAAIGDTGIYQDSTGVTIENPAGYQGGASAIFSAGDADPQVAAVYDKLVAASTKGGVLRYKVKKLLVLDPSATYGGLNMDTAFNGATYQQAYTWFPQSVLTEGGDPLSDPPVPNNETAVDYSRTVEARLYPEGSIATGGLVLPANAASYEFQIKSGYAETDASSVSFVIDDLEVVVNGDPEILYTPPLPAGSAGFVGRVLSNAQLTGTFSATGLPAGVVIDPATGLVHGTPTTNGTYNVVFSVTRGGVADTTDPLSWVITGAADPIALKITSFTISGTTAVLNWSGAGSMPVNVERSTSLAAGSWSVVSANNTSGTFTDLSAPGGNAFYRLAVP